jgi:hypothetical protein
MENHNTIKILDTKIILKKDSEELTFEPTKNPAYPVKTQYIDMNNTRYFLTKTKKVS